MSTDEIKTIIKMINGTAKDEQLGLYLLATKYEAGELDDKTFCWLHGKCKFDVTTDVRTYDFTFFKKQKATVFKSYSEYDIFRQEMNKLFDL